MYIVGIVYIVLYLVDCLGIENCDVRPAGNRAEWICFFGMNLVLGVFVLTFEHDEQALLEIERWSRWKLWKLRKCGDKLCGRPLQESRVELCYDVKVLEKNGHHSNDAGL